jgi:hypothetical protein
MHFTEDNPTIRARSTNGEVRLVTLESRNTRVDHGRPSLPHHVIVKNHFEAHPTRMPQPLDGRLAIRFSSLAARRTGKTGIPLGGRPTHR